MSFIAVAAGTAAAAGVAQIGIGVGQGAKAKKLEAANVRSDYTTPTEILTNQAIASNRANSGLPSEQYLKQKRDIDRNATRAILAATDRRGGMSAIAATQANTDDATLDLNTADAKQKLANEKNLMQQNQVVAGYKDKEFDWNKKQKYLENASAVRALKGAGNANIGGGINTIVGGAAMVASAKSKQPTAAKATKSKVPSWMANYDNSAEYMNTNGAMPN